MNTSKQVLVFFPTPQLNHAWVIYCFSVNKMLSKSGVCIEPDNLKTLGL